MKARTQRGDANCGPTGAGAGAGAGATERVGLDDVPWSAAATAVLAAAAAWTGVGRSNVDVHVLQDQRSVRIASDEKEKSQQSWQRK